MTCLATGAKVVGHLLTSPVLAFPAQEVEMMIPQRVMINPYRAPDYCVAPRYHPLSAGVGYSVAMGAYLEASSCHAGARNMWVLCCSSHLSSFEVQSYHCNYA